MNYQPVSIANTNENFPNSFYGQTNTSQQQLIANIFRTIFPKFNGGSDLPKMSANSWAMHLLKTQNSNLMPNKTKVENNSILIKSGMKRSFFIDIVAGICLRHVL
jgi:hypothetical protein